MGEEAVILEGEVIEEWGGVSDLVIEEEEEAIIFFLPVGEDE